MTCERCADLEEQIAWLKSELGLTAETTHLHALRRGLKLEPQAAKLLLMLYEAYDRPLGAIFLHESISRKEFEHGSKLVQAQIGAIRKRIGDEGVETFRGRGYGLSFIGRARVQKVLGGVEKKNDSPPRAFTTSSPAPAVGVGT